MSEFGVHSEVGQLRKVIVHRPGLEMRLPEASGFSRSSTKNPPSKTPRMLSNTNSKVEISSALMSISAMFPAVKSCATTPLMYNLAKKLVSVAPLVQVKAR